MCCIFLEHIFLRTPLDGCFWDIFLGNFIVISCIKNWGLSTSNKEDGWSDCVCSINIFQPDNHHIFPCISLYNWILQKFFFSVKRINLIQKFLALVTATFFVIHCWNLLGLLKGKSSILMTNDPFGIEPLTKLSHLRLATFVSTNLDAFLKIHEIHFVPVVLKLKP